MTLNKVWFEGYWVGFTIAQVNNKFNVFNEYIRLFQIYYDDVFPFLPEKRDSLLRQFHVVVILVVPIYKF